MQQVPARVVPPYAHRWQYGLSAFFVVFFFTLIGRNFKGVLFIGFLCFTNEHYIPIDLNRFQVVSGVVKKVGKKAVHIVETNYHMKSDSCG